MFKTICWRALSAVNPRQVKDKPKETISKNKLNYKRKKTQPIIYLQ